MLDYIKALSTKSRNAIETIHFNWEGAFTPRYIDAGLGIMSLSLCGGLRNLEIDVSLLDWWFDDHVESPFGFEEIAALRGLKSFKLQYHHDAADVGWSCAQRPALVREILGGSRRLTHSSAPPSDQVGENMLFEIKELEDTIRDQVTKARGTADLPSPSEIAEILSHSTVVDGDSLRTLIPDKPISINCDVAGPNVKGLAAVEAYLRSR